jgi:3-hydroxyacyl-CoA dehydrogenase
MWYADTVGLEEVYNRVRAFEAQHGPWWKPPALLQQLAEAGKTFADLDKEKAAVV